MTRSRYVQRPAGVSCGGRSACSHHANKRNGAKESDSWK